MRDLLSAIAASFWWAPAALTAGVALAIFLATASILPRIARRRLERELGADSFDSETIRRATENYVEPDCSQLDPSGAEDYRGILSLTSPLMPRMDELLRHPGARKHYLVLADSGMGKTSFLVNYFYRNRKRRSGQRLRLVLVSLGRPDALKKLGAVQHKKETVALLDAFDEDTQAIEDHQKRIHEIMSVCADFRRVVISSRTQFFSSEEEIPREAGVAIVAPRRAGQPHEYVFEKIYLAPFSERQIETYLTRCLPWYQWRRRREARSLVVAMSELATRPVLLTLVPELASAGRSISELFELYEFMVEGWLEHERGWIEPDILRAISKDLSVNIFLRSSTGGADRMKVDQVAAIAGLEPEKLELWQLATRSLLNRDAVGNFKFAHPSILEYLFVCAFADGDVRCLSIRWSDFMRRLFVSWANITERRHGEEVLRRALNHDFTATNLFPLSDRHPSPDQLYAAQILNPASASGLNSRHHTFAWDVRKLYVTEHRVEDSVYLCDRASDTVFYVATDWRRVESGEIDGDSAALFVVARADADRQIDLLNARGTHDRTNWRLPTLEELDLLYLWNREIPLLPRDQFLWTADRTEEGHRIVARMCGAQGDDDPRLEPIGMRKVLGAKGDLTGYFVSSFPLLGPKDARGHFDTSFRALIIRVSQGAAESFARTLCSAGEPTP